MASLTESAIKCTKCSKRSNQTFKKPSYLTATIIKMKCPHCKTEAMYKARLSGNVKTIEVTLVSVKA